MERSSCIALALLGMGRGKSQLRQMEVLISAEVAAGRTSEGLVQVC